MNTSTSPGYRREYLLGLTLGLYAAILALAPGWAAKAILCVALIAFPLGWWLLGRPNRWLLLFFIASWLLPPLPIELGNSGPHVAVLLAGAGLFIGMLRLSEWRFHIDAPGIAITAILSMLLASMPMAALFSGFPVALSSFARLLLFAISVYVFFYIRSGPAGTDSRDSLQLVRVLFWAGAVAALFACIDFYFQFPAPAGYGPQFIWLDTGVFRRAQGLFYEASTLGNFCAFFLEMTVIAIFRGRAQRPLPVWALIIGAGVFATALILSYSRASLVNVAVALVTFVSLYRERIGLTRLLITAGLFIGIGAALLFAVVPDFSRAYWFRISTSVQYFFLTPDAVLSGRVRSWATLQDFLTHRPWHVVLGVGYKTLPYSYFIGTNTIADNTYLSTLVETGVLGFVALVALLTVILRKSYLAAHSGNPHRAFLGTWSLCFWTGQVFQFLSGDLLTYWRVLPAYLCVFALAIGDQQNTDP